MTIETRVQRLEALAGEQHGREFDHLSDEQLDAEIAKLEAAFPKSGSWSDTDLAAAWECIRHERLPPFMFRSLSDEALELRIAAYQWACRPEQADRVIGTRKEQEA